MGKVSIITALLELLCTHFYYLPTYLVYQLTLQLLLWRQLQENYDKPSRVLQQTCYVYIFANIHFTPCSFLSQLHAVFTSYRAECMKYQKYRVQKAFQRTSTDMQVSKLFSHDLFFFSCVCVGGGGWQEGIVWL